MTTGWQPISTAPKDGTRILVVWPDGSRGVAWWTTNLRIVRMLERIEAGEPYSPDWCSAMQSSHFIDHGEWDDYEVSLPKNQPTHWMPLPEPPA